MAAKWLGDVPQGKQFWCRDGRILQNLAEMEVALTLMTDETFRYHSNEVKKDFSRWIKDVIGDEGLAQSLQRCGTRLEGAKAVADRVAWLSGV
jgi:hypothetical protein